MINNFLKQYKKEIGNQNLLVYISGLITVIFSIILFFFKKIILSLLLPYIYIFVLLLCVLCINLKKEKKLSLFIKNNNKELRKKVLLKLIYKYQIEDINSLYNIFLTKCPVTTKSKMSYWTGLSIFLTIVLYFINSEFIIDIDKLQNVFLFSLIYSLGFIILYTIIGFLKLIKNDDDIIEEISELLFEIINSSYQAKDYKKLFFEKSLIGRNIDFNNVDDVLENCMTLAYRDMLSAGRYYISRIDNFIMKKFINDAKEILSKNNYKYTRDLLEQIIVLFGENEIIGSDNKYVTRLGLTQKFLNMTYKYFYCFNEYLETLKIDYSNCDCPLDSIILEKIGCKQVWSKLKLDEYLDYQKQISTILLNMELDEEIKNIGNLAYDFLMW